jgi:peptidoglycan/LPS O-acetylase OafA/YrhL
VSVPTRPAHRSSGALLGRSRALDGLRGLALTWIVAYHFTAGNRLLPGGWVGLDVFFVLSGFLITAVLLDEHRVTGRVSLRRFYARRALRLLPALLVMLAGWTVLLLLFGGTTWFAATPGTDPPGDPVDVGAALRQVGLVLLYVVNWVYALGSGAAPLAHLWSLAVEEQFYVVWPLVLLLLLRLRRTWPVVALAVVSAALPLVLYDGGAGVDRIYFGTDTRAVGMLLGALAALRWHRRRSTGATAAAPAARAWAGAAAVGTVLLTVDDGPVKSLAGPALMGLAAMQLVPYLVDEPGSRMARALRAPVLVWLGQRSYAVYLWHYLFATWLNPAPPEVGIPLGVTASLVVAELSWRFVEAPALRFARRYAAPQERSDSGRGRPQAYGQAGHAPLELLELADRDLVDGQPPLAQQRGGVRGVR